MKSCLPGRLLAASLCLVVSSAKGFAADCAHPYDKTYPYQLPLGGEKASVLLNNEFQVQYDCESFAARNDVAASAKFMKLNLDVVQAQGIVNSARDQDAYATARFMVLGYEVHNEYLNLSEIVNKKITPDHDIDISDSMLINIGPLPVYVKYGVTGHTSLDIFAGVQGPGLNLNLKPAVESHVYVQASVDLNVVQAVTSGEMLLIRDHLDNRIRFSLDNDAGLSGKFNLESKNRLRALDGGVVLNARTKLGDKETEYRKDLFQWAGVERKDLILQISERLPLKSDLIQ